MTKFEANRFLIFGFLLVGLRCILIEERANARS